MNGLNHRVRETHRKIAGRLALVGSLVYRRSRASRARSSLRLFDHVVDPPEAADAAGGEDGWIPVPPYTYWGRSFQNFALAGEFAVPPDFDPGPPARALPALGRLGRIQPSRSDGHD